MERVAAAFVLVLLLPLLAMVGVVIWILSGAAPLVAHRRVGRFGKPFWMLKFRTMWERGERGRFRWIEMLPDPSVPEIKTGGDARVTSAFARFCRKHSIDELPQLWHVATGEMSLVGPRPPIPYEIEAYDIWHRRRLLESRPGITGLWQVHGRSKTTFDEMVRLDLQYSRMWSPMLDVKILLQTPRAVFSGDGAY